MGNSCCKVNKGMSSDVKSLQNKLKDGRKRGLSYGSILEETKASWTNSNGENKIKVTIIGQSSVGKTVFHKTCLDKMESYNDSPTSNGEFAVIFIFLKNSNFFRFFFAFFSRFFY